MKIPKSIKQALIECGKPYSITCGRHSKIWIDGKMVGTFTPDGKEKGDVGYLSLVRRIKSISSTGGAKMGKLREAWFDRSCEWQFRMLDAITEAEAEIERLKAINAEHCRAIGILTIDGDRLTRERDEARSDYERRHKEATDHFVEIIALKAERDAALAKVERMDAALAEIAKEHFVIAGTDKEMHKRWRAVAVNLIDCARAARKDQP